MIFTLDDESMKYKDKIGKSKRGSVDASTKEYMVFFVENTVKKEVEDTVENTVKNTVEPPKKIKVRFTFDWLYDKEDGFCYKKLSQFSGHKRYSQEDREWLENYCKENYPDGHHMSY